VRDFFQIADLVLCKYDFEYIPFHNYSKDDDIEYVGIIVRINTKTQTFYGNDVVHQVYCLDGVMRYFIGAEMKLIYR